MQILIVAAVAAVQMLTTGRVTRSEPLLVTAVPRGDAITVSTLGRVRLLGIEAGFSHESRERLAGLVLNRWVYLEFERENRRLAYVVTGDGQFVNAVLVREGLARVTASESLTRAPELRRAEAEYTRRSGAIRSSAPKTHKPAAQRKKKKP